MPLISHRLGEIDKSLHLHSKYVRDGLGGMAGVKLRGKGMGGGDSQLWSGTQFPQHCISR